MSSHHWSHLPVLIASSSRLPNTNGRNIPDSHARNLRTRCICAVSLDRLVFFSGTGHHSVTSFGSDRFLSNCQIMKESPAPTHKIPEHTRICCIRASPTAVYVSSGRPAFQELYMVAAALLSSMCDLRLPRQNAFDSF